MELKLPLILQDGKYIITESGATILMDAGGTNQIAYITQEAMQDIASPPSSDLQRLMDYLDTFSDIASEKYDKGLIEDDGRVWVRSADVLPYRA